MSFLSALRKSMGLKTQDDTFSKPGRVLGTKEQSSSSGRKSASKETPSDQFFDLIFLEERLGIGIVEFTEKLTIDQKLPVKCSSRALVQTVSPGGEAERVGVKVGDVIIALNGQYLERMDDFYNFAVAMGRPITLKFYRPPLVAPSIAPVAQSAVQASSSSDSNSSKSKSIFSFGSKSNTQQAGISEQEKQNRREMLSKAANERSQKWDKKVSSGKLKREESNAEQNNKFEYVDNMSNPETLRVIQKTKELETKIEQSMGYSPFRPHMSFTGNGAAAAMAAGHANNSTAESPRENTGDSQSNTPKGSGEIEYFEEVDEDTGLMIAEVDDAFAMLLSLGEADQDVAKNAVQTVQKMLQNLVNNKSDPKFRSIRLNNKAFQSKVACVSGAIELLAAAGYNYEFAASPIEATASSLSPILPTGESNSRKWAANSADEENNGDLNSNEGKEAFLIHRMDAKSERKLVYTLSRLQELMDMQNSMENDC